MTKRIFRFIAIGAAVVIITVVGATTYASRMSQEPGNDLIIASLKSLGLPPIDTPTSNQNQLGGSAPDCQKVTCVYPKDRVPDPSRSVINDVATLTKEKADLGVLLPKSIPSGFKFAFAQDTTYERGVEQIYRDAAAGAYFSIVQTKPDQKLNIIIEPEKVLRNATVQGQTAVVYDPGTSQGLTPDERSILTWTDGQNWYEIQGTISIDQKLAVANSLSR